MSLMQLFEQHERDLKSFAELRDQKWAGMMERHSQVAASFGGAEKLPAEYQKKHELEKQQFIKEWSNNTGTKHKALVKQYEQATNAYKQQGKKLDKAPSKAKPSQKTIAKPGNPVQENRQKTEIERKKHEMIKQQKAMTAKRDNIKKRSR